jgi:hypothetical protein
MRTKSSFLRPLLLAALATVATASIASAAWPADHIDLAEDWIFNPYIDMANNAYGAPASIWTDGSRSLHAITKCGSFTALLLKGAYPGVITDNVLNAIVTSNSPYADRWYTAIIDQVSDPAPPDGAGSGIGFHKRASAAAIQPGDILASAYTQSGDTGHVMTVKSITKTASGTTLPSGKTITGVGAVNKYEVVVYDSTKTPHGAYDSNPAPDTRYRQLNQIVLTWTKDEGIGSGTIVLYEEVSTGRIVSWAWNVSPTTGSYYYAVTPNPGSWEYRPMVAGYLAGPGL